MYFLVICKKLVIFLFIFSPLVNSDNFIYNNYNNHGAVGIINIPTARLFDEGVHGVVLYDGTPDQKITLTSSPYDWLEASFFYTNIQDRPYPGFEYQDYKDKGFNFKLRIKNEDEYPAIAIGINDMAGTGFYSSEYVVASQGFKNLDVHFGLGWGALNGSKSSFRNPLINLSDNFKTRPEDFGKGGEFEPSRYYSGSTISPFFGFSYVFNEKIIFKYEKDPTQTPGFIGYKETKNDNSYGIDFSVNSNFTIGLSHERGDFYSLKITYKNNPELNRYSYNYKKSKHDKEDNKYTKLIRNLENNGIGVNKILETSESIGIELTQFIHPNLQQVEQIISQASIDAGIKKNIKKDIKIANLSAISEIDNYEKLNSRIVYQRENKRFYNSSTGLRFRPFLASREEFFKGALLIENNTEIVLREDLFINTNLKYSILDNFDDLRFPPKDTFPAQVRSDIKQYLLNMDDGILIGRAQIDYHLTPKKNHHLMFTGGILEDMFQGVGFEYLYYNNNKNYAYGFELFNVKKRDYKWRFGTLDYNNTIGSINLYYRNYGSIPFDMKVSLGEYLAGDIGSTVELSRSYKNGMKFGVFASFTDVTAEEFGEGSFDKGIFFNIPVYGNFINYTWRPLTKDPGAKLIRKNNLYDLLVKFSTIND